MDFIKAFSNQVSDQLLVTKQNKENEPRPRGMAMDASERSAGPVQRVETFVQFNTILSPLQDPKKLNNFDFIV